MTALQIASGYTKPGAGTLSLNSRHSGRISCYTRAVPEDEALARVFNTYSPMVMRRARRLMGSQADADEAVQEVFLRAMQHPEILQDELDLVGWFYRVTTNHCLNRIRDAKRQRELLNERVRPLLREQDESEPDGLWTLRALLANADEQQARCAAYIYIDELTYDQVASLMGISRRTVGNLMERFKTWARAQLASPSAEESA